MKFNSTINKVLYSYNTNQTNNIQTDRYIETKNEKLKSITFNKKKQSVIIWDNVLHSPGDSALEETYELLNIPENAINYLKPIFFVETTPSSLLTFENAVFTPNFRYLWKKLNNQGYVFQCYYSGTPSLFTEGHYLSFPIYLNLSLNFYNEKIYNAF